MRGPISNALPPCCLIILDHPRKLTRGPQTVDRNLPSSLVMALRTSELPQTRWGVTRNRGGSAGRRLDVKRL